MATLAELQAELSRRELSKISRDDLLAEAQRRQRAQSIPTPDVNEGIGPLQAGAIAAGRGLTTIGRAIGLADPESEAVAQSFKGLQDRNPISTTIGEVAGESAPFLLPGLGAGALLSKTAAGLGARALTAGGLGALEGGAITRGKGGAVSDQFAGAGIGGAAAGALELVLPVIGRIGGKIIRNALGKAPSGAVMDAAGNPSDEFLDALQRSGLTIDDVAEQARMTLAGEAVDPSQAARKSFLETQGLSPTKAQVTRDAADFQAQQEATKTSGAVRDALEGQEAFLTSRFDNAVLGTGGSAVSPTSGVSDVLTSKATALDTRIGELYKQAKDVSPGRKNVRFQGLTKKLRELAPSDRRTGGNISAVVGDMQAKGILDAEMKLVGKVDVETAEDLRKLTNELFDAKNGFGNAKLRELKDALDDDVFKAAGRDVFKEARKAKFDFEKGLSRAKVSKFDSRKKNIVRDILENSDSVNPEQFTDKVVFGKGWRSTDLQQVKDYITDGTGEAGQKAFNDLRAETLHKIKERSFIGPADGAGQKALSRDKLEKAIQSVGDKKLAVLFSKEERKFLSDMVKVSGLREPVRGTALGRGPSAQAIKKIEEQLKKVPIFGSLVDFVDFDASGRAVLRSNPQRIAEKTINAPIGISQVGGAVAAGQFAEER